MTVLLSSALHVHQESPRITLAPKNQIVVNERVASFICTASGHPKPQIEWRKSGKRLVTLRYTVLEIPNGSVLRIEPVRPGRDNATYECLAENGIGEPVREQADLMVLAEDELPRGFPKFTQQPAMQGVERGRSALIPCSAEGDPEPTILWFKDMVPIDLSNPRYSMYQGCEYFCLFEIHSQMVLECWSSPVFLCLLKFFALFRCQKSFFKYSTVNLFASFTLLVFLSLEYPSSLLLSLQKVLSLSLFRVDALISRRWFEPFLLPKDKIDEKNRESSL